MYHCPHLPIAETARPSNIKQSVNIDENSTGVANHVTGMRDLICYNIEYVSGTTWYSKFLFVLTETR